MAEIKNKIKMKASVSFPDECWESIFRFLGHGRDLESVSMVCKRFLTISSQLQDSLTIFDATTMLIPKLFLRFSRLKVLDLSYFNGNLEGLLCQVSQSTLDLDTLNLSNQRTLPIDLFRDIGSKMKNLRVLICSNIGSLWDSHLMIMAYCFPLLQELDISFPLISEATDFGISKLSLLLERLRKINFSGNYLVTDQSLVALCQNCMTIEDISFFNCFKITQGGIANAINFRPTLVSIAFNIKKRRIHGRGLAPMPINLDLIDSLKSLKSLTCIDLSNSFISDELLCSVAECCHSIKKLILQDCCNFTFSGIYSVVSNCPLIQCLDLRKTDFLTDHCIGKLSMFLLNLTSINLSGCDQLTNSTFYTLTRGCPKLVEIKMDRTYLGEVGEDSDSSLVPVQNTQVKSLYLGQNILLGDQSLMKMASICPNVELLDLNSCGSISGECVVDVLRKCREIRHLGLANTGVKLLKMDFKVLQLKVLNLSGSRINDEALSIISKCCCGLVVLDIQGCNNVTTKGVKEVVESCMELRELNLKNCDFVNDNFVASLELIRPSLRRIITNSYVGV
ncbi:F-box protein At-B-like isoform X1 [Arachis hypogaea]|nr:F-box/LRR-repeat protein 3-like isoform X1 [Arachis hypogaea]QHO32980.1 F-box/LRR-repeat protein [Arachis hypogaea]